MFKLPGLPSAEAELHELADFAELMCWKRSQVSTQEILNFLGRSDDNEMVEGAQDSEDNVSEYLDDVMNELARRREACAGGYPFKLDSSGTVLSIDKTATRQHPAKSTAYIYLLLSTRLNMTSNKVHASIDGTSILEFLSAHALKNYLGSQTAQSFVFGTAAGSSFKKRVEALCQHVGEGKKYRNRDKKPPPAKDDKLDVVAWIPFPDNLPGKIIVFGQCKTGTNWRRSVSDLQPEQFCAKWLEERPLVLPARAYCISESANLGRWNSDSIDAGILLERCRLVGLADHYSSKELREMKKWSKAATKTVTLD